MNKIWCSIIFLASAVPANAGGDYVSGRIVEFLSISSNLHSFVFQQNNNEADLVRGCRKFKIKIIYERVPWYSWLPLYKNNHPTWQNTMEALKYIEKSSREGGTVYFGYIGNGLVGTTEQCVFNSKGLEIDNGVVFSFYDPI